MSLLDALRSLVVRGAVTGSDASQQTQALSVSMMVDEDEDGVENFAEPYGLANSLPAGTECIIVSVGGAADHQVVVGTADKANRPDDLEAGEVAIYSRHGQSIRLLTDGSIVAIPKPGKTFDVGDTATEAMVMADKLTTAIDTLLSSGVPGAADGGLNLKTTMTTGWNAIKATIKATKGRVE